MFTYLVLFSMSDYTSPTREQRQVVWRDCIAVISQSVSARVLAVIIWILALWLLSRTSLFDQPLRSVWPIFVLVFIGQDLIVEPLVVLASRHRIHAFIASVRSTSPGTA